MFEKVFAMPRSFFRVRKQTDEGAMPFEVFAEAFLVTQESIDSDHYWPQGKIPLVVQENLGLPRNDFGIDSGHLNQTQQYDACQCKFRPSIHALVQNAQDCAK
jgi:hypothetical protein